MKSDNSYLQNITEKYREPVLFSKTQDFFDEIELKKTDSVLIYGDLSYQPQYSIFIPTYNRIDLLKRCLKSAIQQNTKECYEIVVVDNNLNSIFDTELLLYLKELRDYRIKYYVNKRNVGPIENWNTGFLLAKGKWISMVHDDDIIHQDWLEVMIRKIEVCTDDVIAVGCRYYEIRNERDLNCFIHSNVYDDTPICEKKINDFKKGIVCPALGCLIKKDAFWKLGGFDKRIFFIADYIFMTRLSLAGKVMLFDNRLYGYWQAETSDSSSAGIWDSIIVCEYYFRIQIMKRITRCKLYRRYYSIFKLCRAIIMHNCKWMRLCPPTSKKVNANTIRHLCDISFAEYLSIYILAYIYNLKCWSMKE